MGTRSDVAIALSKDIVVNEFIEKILDESDRVIEHEDGKLYLFEYIKWNSSFELAQELKKQSCDKWVIREVCLDYPEDDSNYGIWDDCPWNIQKRVVAEIMVDNTPLNKML